ncbi:MAG TPA: formate dehydrogenase accessory sulfurtransferase FdhD [Burkholderiales bacterium]|nr:formate dehydrogenase accessory sulfurtransferase FdhD [Burkholderiales bacterium]
MSTNRTIPGLPPFRDYTVHRWAEGGLSEATEQVAEEAPVALVYNGTPHVVMMCTPVDLEDFVLGFSLSEGIITRRDELHALDIAPLGDGVQARLEIDFERYALLQNQRRNLEGRTGCGLCGAETIEQAVRHPAAVAGGAGLSVDALHRGFTELARRQSLNAATGAVHAAAWVSPDGDLTLVREDVGRHNALDKLIGAMIGKGATFDAGAALITSRASFEMVQKAATVGIGVVAAISAPTGYAVHLAEETGVTLIAFARNGRHNVYANGHRVHARAAADVPA